MSKINQEQIDNWKKESPEGVWKLTDKTTGDVSFIKTPDRETVSYATTLAQTDPLGFAETIIENSFVGGVKITPNVNNLLGITEQLDKIVKATEYELEKC